MLSKIHNIPDNFESHNLQQSFTNIRGFRSN